MRTSALTVIDLGQPRTVHRLSAAQSANPGECGAAAPLTVNVLRFSLHPGGLAPRIANLPAWRAHVLHRLRRQAETSGDPALAALLAELAALPGPAQPDGWALPSDGAIAVPLEIDTAEGRLSLISTTTVFGTPTEVTLSELAIEAFYPADTATAGRLRRAAAVTPRSTGPA